MIIVWCCLPDDKFNRFDRTTATYDRRTDTEPQRIPQCRIKGGAGGAAAPGPAVFGAIGGSGKFYVLS